MSFLHALFRAVSVSGGGDGFVLPESKDPSGTKKLGFSIGIALLVFLVLVAPASAREWHIARFDTRMSVAQDGVVTVTERLDVVFVGAYHGIYRDIPIGYPGPHGSDYIMRIKVTGVTDGADNELKYESKMQNGNRPFRHLKIYIPDAVDATRTVQIHYTVTNAVRWFDVPDELYITDHDGPVPIEDHDELYWNVTGNDWPVPIESASAAIAFPPNAAGNLSAQAFTGLYGSRNKTLAWVNGNTVSVSTNNPLSMGEGLTADVYITKGVLTPPKLARVIPFLRSNIIVVIVLGPLLAFIVMFFFWWTKGRDPKPDISVAPMYEPPTGMTPAEVGSLMNDAVEPRDITSTLVDLAVKGYLKIEEKEAKTLLFSHRDYLFHLLKPASEWASLEEHERVMLDQMFVGGEPEVYLSDLKNQFYVAIPKMERNILAELKDKGMYSVDPGQAGLYVTVGVLFAFVPSVVALVLAATQSLELLLLVLTAGLIAGIIIKLFALIMPAKSHKGVDTKVEILGFQEFVNRLDADRLKRMPPDTFEKFLPYAMALGIENRWAKAFQGIVQNPPNWYVGPTPYMAFNPSFFAGTMHAMATDAHQALGAAPRGSGGFSGGGSGGGGGGAF